MFIFFLRNIGAIFEFIIAAVLEFCTSITGTRGSVSTGTFERNIVIAFITDMIVRTFFKTGTISNVGTSVNQLAVSLDLFTDGRFVFADSCSDSDFSRTVFNTGLNDLSFLENQM